MSQPKVKTRFAPSPTGYLHVGAARTALFAWLWARHNGGEFHLRIEDTARARFVADAEEQIRKSLQWLGLGWDGEVLHQSDRLEQYRKSAEQLVKAGHARVSQEESGEVIRFVWPDSAPTMTIPYFEGGQRRNERRFSKDEAPTAFEDFVLIKSDGYPTYNFAHVVDDHATGINCVIRGDEFIPSLNKYVALYEAFDWPRPKYVHVPTILGQGKAKLSKRHGAKDILDYRRAGYLPQALANFIALIGWNPGGNKELFFTLEELVEAFTLDGLQKSPGVFDQAKLDWMNGEHLRSMDSAKLLQTAQETGFWKGGATEKDIKIVQMVAGRAKTLKDFAGVEDSFYYHRPKLTRKQLAGENYPETVAVWLEKVQRELTKADEWTEASLENLLTDIREELKLTSKELYPVLREALTGAPHTPALWELLALFGKNESLARLEAAAKLVS